MPRAQVLPESKIEDFFNIHIPDRLAALTSYTRHSVAIVGMLPPQRQRPIATALSYSNCIAGRMLLEFLGISYDNKRKDLFEKDPQQLRGPKAYREFDVHVEELGGRFVRLSDITMDAPTLRTFLHMSNRMAHLTYDFRMESGEEDGWQSIGPATAIIERLIDDHLYRPTGRIKFEIG